MTSMILYSIARFFESNFPKLRSVQITFLLSLLSNLFVWFLFIWSIRPFSYLTEHGNIPLHYNLYFGIDTYGKWYHFVFIPVFGILVILINNILAYVTYNQEKIISQFLIYSQLIINLILLAASIFIVLLNS